MTWYKLTDQKMRTLHGNFQWKLGEKQTIRESPALCQRGFHAYADPLLATFYNPIHARIAAPRLFIAEVGGEVVHDHTKSVWQEMTLLQEVPVPAIPLLARVRCAIYCAQHVCREACPDRAGFNAWAARWLAGEDRSAEAAWAAARAAEMETEIETTEEAAAWAAARVAEETWAWAAEEEAAWAAATAAAKVDIDVAALLRQAIVEEQGIVTKPV